MDIDEAFNFVMEIIFEHDRNLDRKYFMVKRHNLSRHRQRVLETAADAAVDYLNEEHNLMINVTRREDGYLICHRPFTWVPKIQYGFSCRMFNHIFSKYDDALVKSCIKLARDAGGMLYSEVRTTHGIRRCYYGVRVHNKDTNEWDSVYEGSFSARL